MSYKPLTTLGGALDQKAIDAINNASGASPVVLSGAADALDPHNSASYLVTKAGVDAMTLAAPTAGVDDGVTIEVISDTAYAHTLTSTGNINSGAAGTGLLTFPAYAGATVKLRAYNGKWNLIVNQGVTVTS